MNPDNVLLDGIGNVQLVETVGSELSIVRAARVSYDSDHRAVGHLNTKDENLIETMLRNEHGTPFEHASITFMVYCPIFVARQWMRHRIGWSYNELSLRYTVKKDDLFYQPAAWHIFRGDTLETAEAEAKHWWGATYKMAIDFMKKAYDGMIAAGVDPEQARNLLPVSTYTRFYATTNLRALLHFYKLRQARGAQWEIRQYAGALRALTEPVFPITWDAYKRIYES